MYAFVLLLSIVAIVYVASQNSEGFKTLNKPNNIPPVVCPPGSSSIPAKGELDRSINLNNVKPHSIPGEMPTAPYQQIAASSPLPYQDTTLIKANMVQLNSLLEMLKSFMAFEAQELADKSDPSIQLPLQNAKSDLHVVQREVEVMNRSPGIQSTLTLTNLNEMSSNLAYLQQKVRLEGAAQSGSKSEGFQNQVATQQDLKEFIGRIQGEIMRLSASGTNDPIMNSRVKALTDMKANVQQIIDQVNKGAIHATEIPIMKSDIEKALPILGKPSEPLPQVIKSLKLPAGLANALPSSLQKDPQTMQQINSLISTYGKQFIDGVSATFQVSYRPQNHCNSTIDKSGFPSVDDLNNVSNAQFMPVDYGIITDHQAQLPEDAGRGPIRGSSHGPVQGPNRGPAHFDWKQRAKEIEDQVRQRGLKPEDYGIMNKITTRSKEFSWKGYARMICTRLQATMDPGLPETCGCPPMDWKGWR